MGLPGSQDLIGNLPRNEASADGDYYIANNVVAIVPVWDSARRTGQSAYYRIVRFTGFQITTGDGCKAIGGLADPVHPGPNDEHPGLRGRTAIGPADPLIGTRLGAGRGSRGDRRPTLPR